VGFVGAVEAKQALRDSGLPAVTNISEKGGAAVAAAALNALIYGDPLEELGEEEPPQAPGRTPHKAPQAPLRGPGAEDQPPEASEAPAREADK
jgi:precorrin-8X/cobalt-precorrin-8 methylmutase